VRDRPGRPASRVRHNVFPPYARPWYHSGVGRRLLAIASLISLLMCVALVTMWVRSYRSCITLIGTSWVKSWEGEIEVVKMVELSAPAQFNTHGNFGAELTPEPPRLMELQFHSVGALMSQPTAFGFGYKHGSSFFEEDETFRESLWDCYLVPYWLPVAATAVLPVVWVGVRRFRRKRPTFPVQSQSAEAPGG
jgi:hypothetical protein